MGNRYNANSPDIYNHVNGSLEPLKHLTNLRELNIENTDIEEGLEYLPDSIRSFWSLPNDKRLNAGVERIFNELKKNDGNSNIMKNWYEELKEWRARKFVSLLREREDRINRLEDIQLSFSSEQREILISEKAVLEADKTCLEEERDNLIQQLQLETGNKENLQTRLDEVNNELNTTNNELRRVDNELDRKNSLLSRYSTLSNDWKQAERDLKRLGREKRIGTPEFDKIKRKIEEIKRGMRNLGSESRGEVDSRTKLEEISEIVIPGNTFDFFNLKRETKELKIRDLDVKIGELTSDIRDSLRRGDRELVDEFLRERENVLISGSDSNSENLRNREQELREKISSSELEKFQSLLDKQREVAQLRMQQDQKARIQQANRPPGQ